MLNTVLDEVRTKYLMYYNQALTKIQATWNTNAVYSARKNELSKLGKINHKLQNFYKIILTEIGNDYSEAKFAELRSNAIKIINNLKPTLEEKLGIINDIQIGDRSNKEQEKFLKKTSKLKFSDSTDKEIFIEFIYTHLEQSLEEFYSNDKRFINQSKREAKQHNIIGVNFYRLIDTTGEPYYQIN